MQIPCGALGAQPLLRKEVFLLGTSLLTPCCWLRPKPFPWDGITIEGKKGETTASLKEAESEHPCALKSCPRGPTLKCLWPPHALGVSQGENEICLRVKEVFCAWPRAQILVCAFTTRTRRECLWLVLPKYIDENNPKAGLSLLLCTVSCS